MSWAISKADIEVVRAGANRLNGFMDGELSRQLTEVANKMAVVTELVTALKKSRRNVRYLELVIAEDIHGLNEADSAEIDELYREFG